MCGNANELGDASRDPGKSSLFFLTVSHLEIDLVGAKVLWQAKQHNFVLSGAFLTALENPREIISHPVVLITAAGLQGEQPLVDRTM